MKRWITWCAAALALNAAAVNEELMATKNRLDWLNIVAMLPDHCEEIAADVRKMYAEKSITETAFILTLVPEGNPPVDKAQILGERFEQFRAALGETDMPVGILIQATIGHGWAPNSRSPYQQIVWQDGQEPYQFCPLDKEFQAYVDDAIRRLAALKPDFMMVDDDFRLLTGRGGCFCALHLERFNQQENADYTRETLLAACRQDPALAARYDALLQESLLELARIIRTAIDATDPAMPCSFCACSGDTRHGAAIAGALAAPGQLKTIRINNARYLNESLRTIPEWLLFTARQVAAFPDDCKLLAEPDTFPHNRYSTSAAMFHAQLTHSILSGCRGGKLWLSRTGTYEPESGRLYRQTLSENAGFYQALADLPIQWTGATTVFSATPTLNFPDSGNTGSNITWSTQVLGKMGIPVTFATHPGALVTLAGKDCDILTDAELESLLSTRNCLLDGPAAVAATQRGFGALLGVDAQPWSGKAVTFEQTTDGKVIPVAANLPTARLLPAETTEVLSTLFHRASGVSPEATALTPGATLHRNSGGGQVAIIAAPVVAYDYTAFAMLNESRKAQLLNLFERLGGLDWYIPGDDEVLLRTGKVGDSHLLVVNNLSLDEMPTIPLAGRAANAVDRVTELAPDGSWQPAKWERTPSGIKISRSVLPLRLAVFKITP